MDVNNKRVLQIFTNLTKKGYVIINYRQFLKLKMFKLEYDITLLFIDYISFIRFLLLGPKAICDDKLKWRQGQCPLSLVSIKNMSHQKILQVLMVWIHNDFILSSFKQMMPLLKGIHNSYNIGRKKVNIWPMHLQLLATIWFCN